MLVMRLGSAWIRIRGKVMSVTRISTLVSIRHISSVRDRVRDRVTLRVTVKSRARDRDIVKVDGCTRIWPVFAKRLKARHNTYSALRVMRSEGENEGNRTPVHRGMRGLRLGSHHT